MTTLPRWALALLLVAPPAAAQEPAIVTGRVTDASAAPVAAALVYVEVLNLGASTGADGGYRLVVPGSRIPRADSVRLRVSRVGMSPAERWIRLLPGDSLRVDVALGSSASTIEGVMVTGAGKEAGRLEGVSVESERSPARDVTGARGEVAPPPPPPPMSPPPPPPPPPSPMVVADAAGVDAPARTRPASRAGTLTAGLLEDFDRSGWRRYRDFLARERESGGVWSLATGSAFLLRVVDRRGRPLADHPVRLEQGNAIYELRTLSDGTVRVFPSARHRLEPGSFRVIPAGGEGRSFRYGGPGGHRRPTFQVTAQPSPVPERVLDIAFAIDATGSMADELSYLQTELRDIVARVAAAHRGARIRIAVVFYRDRGDEFVTRALPFTEDIDRVVQFLGATHAAAGGDTPEEMNEALRVIFAQEWTGQPAARMLFVLADAPPHEYQDAQYTYQQALTDATRGGVAIFPVAASGIDRPTEFLMRAMAVMTGGRYLFLTDDSGVGLPHLTPDQPFQVRPLNALMIEEIDRFASARFAAFGRGARVAARD